MISYNRAQIISIRKEYLISYNRIQIICVRKGYLISFNRGQNPLTTQKINSECDSQNS